LEKSPEFFEEMGKVMEEYKLNHLFSLAVLKRDELVAQEHQNYVEINSLDLNKSIVQLWNTEDTLPNSIRTSWSFKGPKKLDCHGHKQCIGHHTCIVHLN
jgi:hypothetical protein